MHDELFTSLQNELRGVASRMRFSYRDLLLQTTDVVNATYVRVASIDPVTVRDRSHYLALAVRAMRFYLIDEARRLRALKRGDLAEHAPLDDVADPSIDDPEALLQLVDAIDTLRETAPDDARVVELHVFGLKRAEIAAVIGRTERTVTARLARGRQRLAAMLDLPSDG